MNKHNITLKKFSLLAPKREEEKINKNIYILTHFSLNFLIVYLKKKHTYRESIHLLHLLFTAHHQARASLSVFERH